jgi:hypothetical protein
LLLLLLLRPQRAVLKLLLKVQGALMGKATEALEGVILQEQIPANRQEMENM